MRSSLKRLNVNLVSRFGEQKIINKDVVITAGKIISQSVKMCINRAAVAAAAANLTHSCGWQK